MESMRIKTGNGAGGMVLDLEKTKNTRGDIAGHVTVQKFIDHEFVKFSVSSAGDVSQPKPLDLSLATGCKRTTAKGRGEQKKDKHSQICRRNECTSRVQPTGKYGTDSKRSGHQAGRNASEGGNNSRTVRPASNNPFGDRMPGGNNSANSPSPLVVRDSHTGSSSKNLPGSSRSS